MVIGVTTRDVQRLKMMCVHAPMYIFERRVPGYVNLMDPRIEIIYQNMYFLKNTLYMRRFIEIKYKNLLIV